MVSLYISDLASYLPIIYNKHKNTKKNSTFNEQLGIDKSYIKYRYNQGTMYAFLLYDK